MSALLCSQQLSTRSFMLPPQEFDELSEEGDIQLGNDDESDDVTFAGLDESFAESGNGSFFKEEDQVHILLNESEASGWGSQTGADLLNAMLAQNIDEESVGV